MEIKINQTRCDQKLTIAMSVETSDFFIELSFSSYLGHIDLASIFLSNAGFRVRVSTLHDNVDKSTIRATALIIP